MTDRGKIDREFFDQHIYPNLGAERADVALGPRHGVDFGVLDAGGTAVVTATDPISILPDLGWDRAARFALGVVLADVAVSGIPPSHLAIEFTLPPAMTDEEFAAVWTTMHDELDDLGTAVLTGHTARYHGCSFPWVGGATVLGVGDHDDVIRPDGARPGDHLLVTHGPAVEATALFANLYPDQLRDAGTDADLDALADRLPETGHVRDALVAAASGPVTAMHDATECGLHGALVELAETAGVGIDFDPDAVPVGDDVRAVCAALDMDPWASTTSGTLLVAVRPEGVDDVLAALRERGTPVADAGRITDGAGVSVDGERLDHPEEDPAWRAYAELAEAAATDDGSDDDESRD
ncbi:AIR synthase family protein [Haloarchaeobius amylolyticus]|uniref:AIR synthase family protein n=1 Tax=Haloarchaeobius amylolyticus TaxID=1198296 RepID=UPI00226DA83B|nr:AIR synthase family protein [Haloarchaeobius amylolyticus]